MQPLDKRELMHTSLTFVGQAYNSLRAAGVPRSRIITVVQLNDYLRSPHLEGDGSWLKGQVADGSCRRLLDEGGATYDFKSVNPATVWSVLLGEKSDDCPVVVPSDHSGALFVAIYSHGDSHPATASAQATDKAESSRVRAAHSSRPWAPAVIAEKKDYTQHEWYCHFPYPAMPASVAQQMTAFVATETAEQPQCYLYATQLRALFAQLFARHPERPIFTLLNYCRSGGALEFLRRESSRQALGVEKWPLFLAASSQAEHDALVGGLWEPFFEHLATAISSDVVVDGDVDMPIQSDSTGSAFPQNMLGASGDLSLKRLFYHACRSYFESSVYELSDHVVSLVIPDRYEKYVGAFRSEINKLLVGGPHGSPDFDGLEAMQEEWESGRRFGQKVLLRKPYNWDKRASLTKAVRKAQLRCAMPEFAIGGCEVEKFSTQLLFAPRAKH